MRKVVQTSQLNTKVESVNPHRTQRNLLSRLKSVIFDPDFYMGTAHHQSGNIKAVGNIMVDAMMPKP